MSEHDSTIDRVRKVIADQLGTDIEDIEAHHTMDELGIDGINITELLMNLDDEFGTDLRDDSITHESSVEDVVKQIKQHELYDSEK